MVSNCNIFISTHLQETLCLKAVVDSPTSPAIVRNPKILCIMMFYDDLGLDVL